MSNIFDEGYSFIHKEALVEELKDEVDPDGVRINRKTEGALVDSLDGSSSSGSFLTIIKGDSSSIAITDKYKQNMFKDKQYLHLKEPLLRQPAKQHHSLIVKSIWRYLVCPKRLQKISRKIFLNGDVFPPNSEVNVFTYPQSSPFIFIPLILFHHFSSFSNIFLLALTISQLIYDLKVGHIYTYLSPLLLLLSLITFREGNPCIYSIFFFQMPRIISAYKCGCI